jgi:hypothetical protein
VRGDRCRSSLSRPLSGRAGAFCVQGTMREIPCQKRQPTGASSNL